MLPEDILHIIWKLYYTNYVLTEIKKVNKLLEVDVRGKLLILTFERPVGYIDDDLLWSMGKSTWPHDIGFSSSIGQPYFTIRYHPKFKKCEKMHTIGNVYYCGFSRSYKDVITDNVFI